MSFLLLSRLFCLYTSEYFRTNENVDILIAHGHSMHSRRDASYYDHDNFPFHIIKYSEANKMKWNEKSLVAPITSRIFCVLFLFWPFHPFHLQLNIQNEYRTHIQNEYSLIHLPLFENDAAATEWQQSAIRQLKQILVAIRWMISYQQYRLLTVETMRTKNIVRIKKEIDFEWNNERKEEEEKNGKSLILNKFWLLSLGLFRWICLILNECIYRHRNIFRLVSMK